MSRLPMYVILKTWSFAKYIGLKKNTSCVVDLLLILSGPMDSSCLFNTHAHMFFFVILIDHILLTSISHYNFFVEVVVESD